jgi:NTE family protein
MSTTQPYTNLVFEGGGVKGVAYAGALEVLDSAGILAQVTAVAGTSAGAITAALVALGQTPDELRETMLALDFGQFEDGGMEGPWRLVEHFGWYRGDAFKHWMQAAVKQRLGSADATFADLADANGLDLHVVATDLTLQVSQVFSAQTSPDTAIADAVRMSMSIPLFFAAVSEAGSVYVDGGVVWNYPVEIFDGDEPNMATLGLRLVGPPDEEPKPMKVGNVPEYVKALYESILQVQSDFYERSAADVARTIPIDDLGLTATDFAITHEQKLALIASGTSATRAFLAGATDPAS